MDSTYDEPDIRLVEAHRWPEQPVQDGAPSGGWQVTVAAMEFVRGGTTEVELRQAIMSALIGVLGVTKAYEEDREVWGLEGDPSGERLVREVSEVVDAFADRIRVAYNGG